MAKLFNLARMTTATTGTGTITLGSAVAGFLSFASAGIADGDRVTYAIDDGNNSEIGRGTYTASGTTLTRSVLRSTNSNNAINLSGTAQVFITPAKEDFQQDGQCQLTKSGSNLVLNPYQGNRLLIDDKVCIVPSGGVSLAATGLIAAKATTNRAIATSVATLTHASGTAIPVGARIGVKGVGGANFASYLGAKTVTASSTTTVSFASGSAVTDASTADTNGTIVVLYCIYAADTDGDGIVETLEASTTWYAVDSATGVETKSGDTTRRLVGIAAVIAGPAWADSATQRFVRSWFNDPSAVTELALTTAPTSTSASVVEISSSWRLEMLALPSEDFLGCASMSASNNTAGNGTRTIIAFDGTSLDGWGIITASTANGHYTSGGHSSKSGVSEGYHVMYIMGKVSSTTGAWNWGSSGEPGQISARVGL